MHISHLRNKTEKSLKAPIFFQIFLLKLTVKFKIKECIHYFRIMMLARTLLKR